MRPNYPPNQGQKRLSSNVKPINLDMSKVEQRCLLVVHHDASIVQTLVDIFNHDAFQLDILAEHAQALNWLSHRSIDGVLLGTATDDPHSFEMCRQLRQQRTTRDVPIIMLGDRNPDLITAAFATGASDYLSVPLLAEEVWARVQHHFDGYRRRQQLSHQNKLLLNEVRERKLIEDTLRQTEDKYRRIFENATEGIFQSSPEGKFISVNPALASIYGYDSPEDLMQSINDIGTQIYAQPKRRDELIVYLQRFEKIVGAESEVWQKDGTKIWISETIRKVYDEIGGLLYFEGIVHDITERRRMEMELRLQRQQADRLLVNILPYQIANRLKMGTKTIAESFEDVTVLFADLVEFTAASVQMVPKELVELLNEIFSTFDRLAEKHGLEKIKTIGDAYMAAAGLPVPRLDHMDAVAQMALEMQQAIAQFKRPNQQPFQLRIGISSGPVIAGVIGVRKFAYDLWGDTVNVASRMESTGIANRIQVTPEIYDHLRNRYTFEHRGPILVKGRGQMESYWLTGRKTTV